MSTPTVSSSSDLQANFLKLLITQLQNQNPLNPVDTKDMSGQLAQFSQLQQLESMNTSFSNVLGTLQKNYATNLVGKDVSYTSTDANDNSTAASGKVSGVSVDSNDDISLLVGNQQVSLADILSITD